MNKKLIGLMITAVIGLSACGSSGGARNGKAEGHSLGATGSSTNNNNTSTSSSNTSSTTNTSTTTTTTTDNNTTTKSAAIIYGSISTEHKDRDTYFSTSDTTWEFENLDEVQIDGRRIALVPKGKSAKNGIYESPKEGEQIYTGTSTAPYAQDSTKSWRKIATDLKYARYGEIYDEYEKHHLVVNGEATLPNKMPTANEEVIYKGKALHNKDSYTAALNGTRPIQAASEFRVNFHQKSLTGTIKPLDGATGDNAFDPVSLKATIKENKFEGSDTARVPANTTLLTKDRGIPEETYTPAYVKGYFYGPNAEEMAGAYYKITGENEVITKDGSAIFPRNTLHGTFGASKQ